MNLWFRLAKLLLSRPWRTKTSPFSTIVTKMRVWPTDLDINRHVTNGRYFSMSDIARIDYLFKTGGYKIALEHRALPIVGDNWGRFRKELKLFQKFEIHTKVLGWDEKWMFIQHDFIRSDRVIGCIIMRGGFRAGKEILKPSTFIDGLGLPATSPEIPIWVQRWSQSCEELIKNIRDTENIKGNKIIN